jgi:hypothetical protein
MKPFNNLLTLIALTAFAGLSAFAAELESTTPVAAKTNSGGMVEWTVQKNR